MKVLITGGAGYIGSHTCVELMEAGWEVVVADNLCNSNEAALAAVNKITGKQHRFYKADITDEAQTRKIFENERPDAVIHFAALKAVGESVEKPLAYYQNNLGCLINLCGVMADYGVKRIVFSSSATVYGTPEHVPIKEDFPLSAVSPYGHTKLMAEQILTDIAAADPEWEITLLRYFNPAGAHPGGMIGEDPSGIPNNLMPYISKVAAGTLDKVRVFGNDYPTHDGTGVRDYIHITDLAHGHLKALEHMKPGVSIYNLCTGTGYSVLDVINNFQKASGKPIPYEITGRRPGDIAECYADPRKAKEELGWEAKFGLPEMCRDAWNWQKQNPNGFRI